MAIKIGVLIKYVPDTNARIQLKDGKVDETNLKYVINPYDEFAIEEALRTREAWKKEGQEVEVVGVCLGPSTASKALKDAFAVGIDRGTLIKDEERKATDPKSTSTALAAICKEENFHLIFTGKQAVDTDAHSVAVMVAERLGLPHIGVAAKCEFQGTEKVRVERDVAGGLKEIFDMKLPALITANKGLNVMRMASLPGIRAAKKKEVQEVALPDIASDFEIVEWGLPPERGECKMIQGSVEDQAKELVRVLREEVKLI